MFNFALMVSGYVQIRAVLRIRSYFQDNESELNLKTLALHAMAFGLYMLTLLINSIVASVTQDWLCMQVVCEASLWATLFLNFLSQISLNLILLDLGAKSDDEVERGSEVTLQVEDFDEQAETHAKIWNSFARDRLVDAQGSDTFGSQLGNNALLASKIKKSHIDSFFSGQNKAKSRSPQFGSAINETKSPVLTSELLSKSRRNFASVIDGGRTTLNDSP